MTRVLHFADAQLGVGGRLDDQAAVLDRIADVADAERVDLVVNAGDTFHGPIITPEQQDVYAGFVARLRDAGIPLVMVSGNGVHDLALRGPTGVGIFRHIPGVEVHTTPGVSVRGGAAVACLPWVHPGRYVARQNGGDRDVAHVDVAELLLRIAAGLREDCDAQAPGVPAILVAHWAVSGATLPTGLPVDALREPVIPLLGLQELGFDAVLLGHIHRAQVLSEAYPWIGYAGSPQPHNHGEAGYDHGVWILTFGEGTATPPETTRVPSPDVTAEFVPVESRQFVTLDVDLTGHGEPMDELLEAIANA